MRAGFAQVAWSYVIAAVAPLAACGGVSAGPDAAAEIDATPAACDLSKPFAAPVEVGGVNSVQNDSYAAPSADGLSIFISSDRDGASYKVYSATRATTADPFGAPVAVVALNQGNTNTFATSLSADGLTLYLYSDRPGTTFHNILAASRPSLSTAFGAPAEVANVNATPDQGDAYITAAGTTLYMASYPAGTAELYVAPLVAGQFGTPMPVGALNSPATETSPVLTADELTIFFTRDEDIHVARRSTTADGFGTAAAVGELNTGAIDRSVGVSPDGCMLWMVSNGQTATGGVDVFTATRPL